MTAEMGYNRIKYKFRNKRKDTDRMNFEKFHVVEHPLIKHKLSIMRDKETGSKAFRQLLSEITMLMGYEVTRDLPLVDVEIETPVAKMTAKRIEGRKLAIMASIAFHTPVTFNDVYTEGITKITKEDIAAAAERGCKIKLIAEAKIVDGNVEYSVKPMELPVSHPLAGINNEFNAVFVKGNAVDELMFYGKGAGPLPTGSAVMGDVLEIAKLCGGNK